jgi:hypothetical protein
MAGRKSTIGGWLELAVHRGSKVASVASVPTGWPDPRIVNLLQGKIYVKWPGATTALRDKEEFS